MKQLIFSLFFILAAILSFGQTSALTDKEVSEGQIMILRNSTLVVRLKTNEKSIDAYRRAGKKDLADKLSAQNKVINLSMMKAFLQYYNFSKVLFIYAKDSKKLLSHEPYIFLNSRLEVDSSITLQGDSFFVAEEGTVMDNIPSSTPNQKTESNNPASYFSLLLLDTSLTQLKEPFPFYIQIGIPKPWLIYLSAFNPSTFKSPYSLQGGDTRQVFRKQLKSAPPDSSYTGRHYSYHYLDSISKKNVYDIAVKRLNTKLIGYFEKVSRKNENPVHGTDEWWEINNPNGNVADRIYEILLEFVKIADDVKKSKPQ